MLEYSMFERLPFRSQAEAIAKNGTILARRKYNTWHVTLYEFNDTFVELWSGDAVQVFSTFKASASKVAIFEPYLDSVDVGELGVSEL
ncbi:hypothetical protein [Pontibacter fetidus]|uniref:Uncharacterized protein n=1 Tax=Pontibacter fetidus TaxID=2700082 RepID=A0A6B2H2D4_9BACT|nr:hypothetical protein [Pontibacter fetidus]NDK57439.1 hypothetical protein [Pontibacter fetidus]